MSNVAARIYRVLLQWLVPSMDGGFSREAADTFHALSREARNESVGALLRFWMKEGRSLLGTAWAEFRGRRRNQAPERKAAGSPNPPGKGSQGPSLAGLARLIDVLTLDVRFAVRNLARTPGFLAVTLASLTFGIAVSTVLFTIANAVFIRPLPHAEDPDALVRVFSGAGPASRGPLSYPDFLDLRESTTTLADVAVARDRSLYVGSAAEGSSEVWGLEVSENYFDVLGIPMARGRGFLPEDVAEGRRVAVIGHNLWQRRFGADPGVLGREILVNGQPHVVVGVGPEGMVSPDTPALLELAVPTTEFREERGFRAFTGVARVPDGVSLPQVQAELDAFARNLREAHPRYWESEYGPPRGLHALTLHQAMVPDDSMFWMAVIGFLAAVGLILLITCSNVANLLLTRAFRRREEIAVRAAIGARGRRILGQLLTENLILFGLAGISSIAFLFGLQALLKAGVFSPLPVAANFDLDGKVVVFTAGLTLLSGFTFGLLPAVQVSRPDLIPALKGRSSPMRFNRFGIRNLLVGTQVGGSAVFVMVTLLLLQSLSHVGDLDLGFEPEGVAVLSIDLAHGDYERDEGRIFLWELKAGFESVAGVEAAEIGTWIPLEGGGTYMGGLEPEGFPLEPGETVSASMASVTPGYLDLLRVRLLRGRSLLPEDREGGEEVALVSQAFVDEYWPGESGVGKVIRREESEPLTVVGVVEDVPMARLAEDPSPHLWLPLEQWYEGSVDFHVRAIGDPREILPAMRRRVADLDPDLPIRRLDLMENVTANGTLLQRILSLIAGVAGAVALALAVLGIYGVVSFSVSQRTREVGLRIALGAEPGRVVRSVVREGFGVALVGLVPGFLLSLLAAQLLRAVLLGANPMNPVAFVAGFGLLGLSVVAASLAPALRASRCQPMETLRAD